VSNPSGRIPCALNAAIAACRHQIIVPTPMHAEGVTPFEKAVAAR
jgi:hypothetical protein